MARLLSYSKPKAGGKPKDDVVKIVRDRLAEAWEHDKDNRLEAQRDLNFLAGNQWPERDRQQREEAGRPMLTINRLPQFVRQVTNDIRQADVSIKVAPSDGAVAKAERVFDPKQEMQRQPAGIGDNGGPPMQEPKPAKPMTMAEVYNGLIREIQYQSSAGFAYAMAAEHQTSCGIGHFRVVTQYVNDDVFDQEIRIKAVQRPLSVYWDPAAVEMDRSDARWCIITDVMPLSAFKEAYPDAAEVDVENHEDSETTSLFWTSTEQVRVAEYWCKKPVKKQIAQLADGKVVELKKGMTAESLGQDIIVQREVEAFKVEQYIVSGSEVLEGPMQWAGKHIPVIPVIGSEIPLEDKTLRYGLIRFARDPQQLYNFARTAAAESMGQAPKSPWLVTRAMVSKFKSIWDNANRNNHPYLPYDPDENAPGLAPTRIAAPEVPAAFVNEAGIADGDIKATVGMYDPQLGQRSNETSGKAILAREKQGDTGTFHYSDNLRFALEHTGRMLIDLIPKIYDNERVVRILGEDNSERYVPINAVAGRDENGEPIYINDLSVGRYDCRVKIGPSYATKRQESSESLMAFMQAMPNAPPLIGDLVATNMDWPGADSIAERLRRAVPPEILGEDAPAPPPPDPMMEAQQQQQQQAIEAQMAEMQAKIEKLQADTQKVMAETERAQAETRKTEIETQMLPIEKAAQFERDEIDRDDRMYQAEASRADRIREFSARTSGATNGSSRPNGES